MWKSESLTITVIRKTENKNNDAKKIIKVNARIDKKKKREKKIERKTETKLKV